MTLAMTIAGAALAQTDPGAPSGRRARPEKPKVPPPSEASLGVPPYPGARFDADVSSGMSMNESWIWVFFSDDAPAKVVAFYEQKTGRKSTEWDKDKFMIALKGKSVVPEHGVTVETLEGNPYFGGKGKTVITVSRMKEK
jgi:hypothetical protein